MPSEKIELPPMPEPYMWSEYRSIPPKPKVGMFLADQMTAYALLAVKQERERCAQVCEGTSKFLAYSGGTSVQDTCAALIRKG